jgi:hypothetical protein
VTATPTRRQIRDALAAVDRAYRKAVNLIDAVPDHQRALDDASALQQQIAAYRGDAADLRARIARRIWETESLSLAALADRIGVSKARADQLIRATNPPEEK